MNIQNAKATIQGKLLQGSFCWFWHAVYNHIFQKFKDRKEKKVFTKNYVLSMSVYHKITRDKAYIVASKVDEYDFLAACI